MKFLYKKNVAIAALLVFVACIFVALLSPPKVFAEAMLDEINDKVDEGLGNLDFSAMDEISRPFFQNFVQKVRQIISGQFDDTQSFFQVIGQLFAQNLSGILPQLISVFCVMVICGLVRNASDGFISSDTSKVVSFVGVTVVIVSVLALVVQAFASVTQLVGDVALLSDAAMPILLTLLVANGGVSSSVCQPAMVVFSSVVISVVKNIILPLSVFALAFVVVGNLSENVKVEKASEFLNSCSSWVLGITFMVFSSFTAVQGIAAASIDGVSYRAAKFAAKNYVPILGGYVSDGLDVIVASTSLIKNAFGAVTMLLVFYLVLKPLITLACVKLGLQAVSAAAEPLADARYVKILAGFNKCLTFLTALVVAVAFMFCILTLVAISCANFA